MNDKVENAEEPWITSPLPACRAPDEAWPDLWVQSTWRRCILNYCPMDSVMPTGQTTEARRLHASQVVIDAHSDILMDISGLLWVFGRRYRDPSETGFVLLPSWGSERRAATEDVS